MALEFKQLKAVFPENTVLFEENTDSKEMYILLSGEVEVTKNGTKIATINTSGAYIGEMATLLDSMRTATVRTTKKSVFLKVEQKDIDTLFKVTPELGYKLSVTLAERVADMTDKLSRLSKRSSAPANDGGLKPQDVSAAQKAVEGNPEIPSKSPTEAMAFLTRTEVHKDVLRTCFNLCGSDWPISELADRLNIPLTLAKPVLQEFEKSGLAKINGENAEILLPSNELQALIEEWIFDNGLFRSAS